MDLAEYLHKELKIQQAALADSLAHGAAKEYSQYREIVGEIKGINRAIKMIEELPRE